jgi:adenylate cyclase
MPLTLDALRECLEGATPGIIATCAADGTPNVSYLSQVQYVDREHVALSFQFFNKTRQNVLANPQARLVVIHPATAAWYRLRVRYLRTETQGPLFESMKAKLAGIASHTGMAGVFRLLGSDVYRVLDIECGHEGRASPPPEKPNLLAALRATTTRLAACGDLNALFVELLDSLQSRFGIEHAMVLMRDGSGERLYTVASRGYPQSGVGSEIPLGAGVIGVAARERAPIRISHMTSEYAYGRAIRERAAAEGLGALLETEIPLPGLAEPRSQLAVPVGAAGVLYVESTQDLRFSYDDEDALVLLAGQLGTMIDALQHAAEADPGAEGHAPPDAAPGGPGPGPSPGAAEPACPAAAGGAPVTVRHYRADDSVFLDDDYLIKGVAGAILWALLRDHAERGRVDFSNRELRRDPRVRLPDISDNLEARLLLLQRRLADREACVRIEKTGRGRFRVCLTRPLSLVEMA